MNCTDDTNGCGSDCFTVEGHTVFYGFIWRKKGDCLLALKYSFLCVLYVHIFPLTFIIKCPDSILEPDKREEEKLSGVATSGLNKKVLRLALSP